jgi:hypothetical protein
MMSYQKKKMVGRINPWREAYLDKRDPSLRKNEY